jgi:uncharacterized protein YodC (DUF2158 family)
MEDFQAGNVVLLQSGSPVMTISKITDETISGVLHKVAHCEWFINGFPQVYNFQLTSLKHFVPKETKKETKKDSYTDKPY